MVLKDVLLVDALLDSEECLFLATPTHHFKEDYVCQRGLHVVSISNIVTEQETALSSTID